MTIASVEVIPYALPFKEPYVTARGALTRREMVLLRIRDEDGVEGLGEAVPLSLRGGASLAQVVDELRGYAGDPQTQGTSSPPAACAIETAQTDLEGRRAGVPVWKVLRASSAEPLRCNATLSQREPVQVAQQALDWEADGFATFKLKLGGEADVETVKMVRQALASEARIRVDANGTWDGVTAEHRLSELEPFGLELAEEPVEGLVEMARLRRLTSIPIAADESIVRSDDAERAAELGACDYMTVKLSKVGALDPEDFRGPLPIYLSSALDGPVGIAATAHAAQALRESGGDAGLAHGLATQRLFASTIASVQCELRGDMLHLPAGPGLGVEIDEAALARHRL
jgi:L-alanine-DL-glutamate epimerase-like enolase superfamily enzyme